MNSEMFKELKDIRRENEIDINVFNSIIALAIEFKEDYGYGMSDEELKEIIIEALSRVDNRIDYGKGKPVINGAKTAKQSFEDAIRVLGYKKTK